jgi:hypothetical protein
MRFNSCACYVMRLQMLEVFARTADTAGDDASKWTVVKTSIVRELDQVTSQCMEKLRGAAVVAKKKDTSVMSSLQQILQASLQNL